MNNQNPRIHGLLHHPRLPRLLGQSYKVETSMSKDPSWSLQGLMFLQNILSRRSEAGIGVQAQLLKLDELWRQTRHLEVLIKWPTPQI
jgi:hypothetical protein